MNEEIKKLISQILGDRPGLVLADPYARGLQDKWDGISRRLIQAFAYAEYNQRSGVIEIPVEPVVPELTKAELAKFLRDWLEGYHCLDEMGKLADRLEVHTGVLK